MDKIQFDNLSDLACRLTKNFNRSDLSDDFTQYAVEHLLNGRKATMKQLFVDFIRQELGDSRASGDALYKTGAPKKIKQFTLWEEYMDKSAEDKHNFDYNAIVDKLEGPQRTMLVLYYEWGFELKEIGKALGVSESRVSQVLKQLNVDLKKKLK